MKHRRDTVILSGEDLPVEGSTENCTQVAMDLLNNKLKVTISTGDMSVAHRNGKQLAGNPDRLKFLVKPSRRNLKADLKGAVKL